jgi:hypothetical protein
MKNKCMLLTVALVCSMLWSCSDDDEITQLRGDILISSMLPNPDGVSGSAFMQLISNINKAEYTNKQAFQASYSVPPIVIGNNVFLVPGWSDQTNKFEKYTLENDVLLLKGEYLLPSKSGAVSCVTKGDKAYISLNYLGKILVINHETMKKITEIDLSEFGVGDNNPDPGIMLIRDDLLYVGLNQLVGGYAPDPKRAEVDVLIIDTNKDKVLKKISNTSSGMSMPTKPEADSRSIFMDENKNIYINCISGFGFIGHKAGFLRIKAGETEFDESYVFDVTQTLVDGEEYKPSYLTKVQYFGNGKIYATGNINERYSTPNPDYLKDKTIICMEVDLLNKTLKKLDLPNSTNYGMSVGLYKGKLVFGLVTEEDTGFYTYDPASGQASSNAVIKVDGYPAEFNHFGEKF